MIGDVTAADYGDPYDLAQPVDEAHWEPAAPTVDLRKVRARIPLYRQRFRNFPIEQVQADAVALADALVAAHESVGMERLLAAVQTAGDYTELIAQLQALAHAAIRFAHHRCTDHLHELDVAIALFESQVGDELG